MSQILTSRRKNRVGKINCPECSHRLKYDAELVGRRAMCTRCGTALRLPELLDRLDGEYPTGPATPLPRSQPQLHVAQPNEDIAACEPRPQAVILAESLPTLESNGAASTRNTTSSSESFHTAIVVLGVASVVIGVLVLVLVVALGRMLVDPNLPPALLALEAAVGLLWIMAGVALIARQTWAIYLALTLAYFKFILGSLSALAAFASTGSPGLALLGPWIAYMLIRQGHKSLRLRRQCLRTVI